MKVLRILNRQKTRSIDAPMLRQVAVCLLRELVEISDYELAIHLVEPEEMARVNQQFLQHEGSTDVITFDNSDPQTDEAEALRGELFVCVADAQAFAKRFHSTWQSEVARYVVHGVLHLRGYDDLQPALRRKMKYQENRLLKTLASRFDLRHLDKSRSIVRSDPIA